MCLHGYRDCLVVGQIAALVNVFAVNSDDPILMDLIACFED
jgi:hypothetical protein